MSLLRRRNDRPRDGSMTLREHLYELRRRMFYAVLALFLGSVVGFIWYTVGIPAWHIQPLGDILLEPYCGVPPAHRLVFGANPDDCALLANTPFSQLTVRLQAGVMAGAVLSCPVWLYQLWAFVTPALYRKERRFAIWFVISAALLFMAGTVIAYLVIGKALDVLLGFGGDTAKAALTPDSYFSFLIGMLLIFGVSLELPLLLVMLNFAGVLKGANLAKARRYAYFGLVVFAALVVPGNDPVSMSVLALVLIVLYEAAVQIAKGNDRRKAKIATQQREELPDDVASPLEPASSPAGDAAGAAATDGAAAGTTTAQITPSDIGTPEPIPPSSRWSDSSDAT